jgi:hypothetical protein
MRVIGRSGHPVCFILVAAGVHVFPNPKTRLRLAEAFFGWCLRHAHRYGEVIRLTGSLDGVAVVYRSVELDQHTEEEQMAATDYASMERTLGEEAHQRLAPEFYGRIFANASDALHASLGTTRTTLSVFAGGACGAKFRPLTRPHVPTALP